MVHHVLGLGTSIHFLQCCTASLVSSKLTFARPVVLEKGGVPGASHMPAQVQEGEQADDKRGKVHQRHTEPQQYEIGINTTISKGSHSFSLPNTKGAWPS